MNVENAVRFLHILTKSYKFTEISTLLGGASKESSKSYKYKGTLTTFMTLLMTV